MIYRKHNGTLEPLVPQPQTPTKLPVNYIYVQLPGTEFPSVLYPNNTWTEVTFSQSYFHRARSGVAVGTTQGYATSSHCVDTASSGASITVNNTSHSHWDGLRHNWDLQYDTCNCYTSSYFTCTTSLVCSRESFFPLKETRFCFNGFLSKTNDDFGKRYWGGCFGSSNARETRPKNIAYRLWRVTA